MGPQVCSKFYTNQKEEKKVMDMKQKTPNGKRVYLKTFEPKDKLLVRKLVLSLSLSRSVICVEIHIDGKFTL